jgi:formylglycine-generating enzyme required for sulfatase activity
MNRQRARLVLPLLALALSACQAPGETLRLSIAAAHDVAAVQRLRVIALVPGTSERATYQAEIGSRDLRDEAYELELDVAADLSPREATLAVLGDLAGAPIASGVLRVPLGAATTHVVTLTRIEPACDLDGDGFKRCAIEATCCDAAESDLAADCDDTEAAIWPFAEAQRCRGCDQISSCLAASPDVSGPDHGGELIAEPTPDAVEVLDIQDALLDLQQGDGVDATDLPPSDMPDLPAPDLPPDLPPDALCVCSGGPCCDGCKLRPITFLCELAADSSMQCAGADCGDDVLEVISDRHCPGDADTCTGALKPRAPVVSDDCEDEERCMDVSPAACIASASCATPLCPAGMKLIPAGAFWMGCNAEIDLACEDSELPQHQVVVPQYCIDLFEVSKADYGQCSGAGATCTVPGSNEPCVWGLSSTQGHPINCVSWQQAKTYCEWADKRLCSEAEWEKAARGGCELHADACPLATPTYAWGNDCPWAWGAGCGDEAWTQGTAKANCAEGTCHDSYEHTAPTSAFGDALSPYGLRSMAGNVSEWVADCWHSSYDADGDGWVDAPTDGSAWVTDCVGGGRPTRGGTWGSALGTYLRAAKRGVVNAASGPSGVGIRCCRDPE